MNESALPLPNKLASNRIDVDALRVMEQFHPEVVASVCQATDREAIVVVGMSGNPFVKKARRALLAANIDFHYLEFGSYLSQWRQRLAIKLWSGWPTFPQIFVGSQLIGGFEQLDHKIKDGSLRTLLDQAMLDLDQMR